MNCKEEIIDYLKRNRISTTEVADCLGKSGTIRGIHALNSGHYCVGEVVWVYANAESNYRLHEQIANIDEHKVVMVEAFDCNDRAIFGELVSKYLLLYKQSKAIVVLGNVRDAAALIRENYPIWMQDLNPIGCFNEEVVPLEEAVAEERRRQYNGSIVVCDDCGVVVIPKSELNERFMEKLRLIEQQEDIWFERLDHYKENTFEIVCKKNYLSDDIYMSKYKKEE